MYWTEDYGKVIEHSGEKDENNHLQYKTKQEAIDAATRYFKRLVADAERSLMDRRHDLRAHVKKYFVA